MLRFILCLSLLSSSAGAVSAVADVNFKSLSAQPLGNSSTALKFADLKGKVVVVDFWASWCAPCKEALPHYNKIYEQYKDKGVVFIGINEDDDAKERDTYLKEQKISFPLFFDKDKQMAKDFKVVALPTLFVFDKNLKPVIFYRGFDDKKPQALEKAIQGALRAQK